MKLRIFTPLLLLLLFVSCSEPIGYKQDVIDVYFNASTPETLTVSTSTFTNDSDYIIPNDGTSEYTIKLIETNNKLAFDFVSTTNVDKLLLLQYIDSSTKETTPFIEVSQNHFVLIQPIENFKIPATGNYKFTVIRYINE